MRRRHRHTYRWYRRLHKRLESLFQALETNLGDPRARQKKSRLREAAKLHCVLNNYSDNHWKWRYLR